MLELPSSRVVCPVGAGSKVRRVVDVAQEVQNSPPIDFEVLELESGADMSIDIPSTEFIVKSFPTCHPVESQGYVLYSKREKLLPELQGLKGAEIKKRKDAGEKVTQSILVPEIAFTGDTTSAFLDGNSPVLADALRAKVLIMEMTYLGIDFTPEQARDRGHMHVQDFVDREDMFKNEAIMLIHFSPRYKRSEILAQLEAALPPKLAARCTPLLNGIE
ncbi:hypothetical protein HYH03_016827 [Edaphochlamys debaryana]|uniref:Uncharacterized protein n=1 Tax=Edaphochlamys debaryana TaxID=47281 RepID=A0A835XHX3_9CHLO|nr:hypothetical protein HYH03_016827 [Edaphochlamys debaryana]|eukprot:KAG2484413.1 hypothetical protein HYH03_016827 [Edaphochlamys debaryana]